MKHDLEFTKKDTDFIDLVRQISRTCRKRDGSQQGAAALEKWMVNVMFSLKYAPPDAEDPDVLADVNTLEELRKEQAKAERIARLLDDQLSRELEEIEVQTKTGLEKISRREAGEILARSRDILRQVPAREKFIREIQP